jgi:hypothetical protein
LSALHLIVHDYDPGALDERVTDLRDTFPHAQVEPFCTRHELLSRIAQLPIDAARRPVALIDLQGDEDRRARGVHLIGTISRHPRLFGRVVAVAFTRYGHSSRDASLETDGARGVLHPAVLSADRHASVAADLERLAAGDPRFVRIGVPATINEQRTVIDRLEALFPGEFQEGNEQARWERGKEILFICRMSLDGYQDTDIRARLRCSDKRLKRLREQLIHSREALRIGAIGAGRTADLGAVARAIYANIDEPEARWALTADRNDLFQPARLTHASDRFEDRYGPAEDPAAPIREDPVWMPPGSVKLLRAFFAAYKRAADGTRKPNPDIETIDARRDLAVAEAAQVTEVEFRRARDEVEHAILCLEEADLDPTAA